MLGRNMPENEAWTSFSGSFLRYLKCYVYVAGADGKLEKRTVTTGKVIWGGEYYEIRSGLSVTDQIAFPYGKNVVAGAPTEAGDLSELYGY